MRSAAIGLMRVARRAGSQVATRAAAASKAGATVKATDRHTLQSVTKWSTLRFEGFEALS